MNFYEKLNRAIARNQSLTIVGLDPNPEMMPSVKYTSENGANLITHLQTWLEWVVTETSDRVGADKEILSSFRYRGN